MSTQITREFISGFQDWYQECGSFEIFIAVCRTFVKLKLFSGKRFMDARRGSNLQPSDDRWDTLTFSYRDSAPSDWSISGAQKLFPWGQFELDESPTDIYVYLQALTFLISVSFSRIITLPWLPYSRGAQPFWFCGPNFWLRIIGGPPVFACAFHFPSCSRLFYGKDAVFIT